MAPMRKTRPDRCVPTVSLGWMPVPRTEGVERAAAALLSPEERNKVTTFRLREDRQRFIAGRACLRVLLSDILGVGPAAVKLGISGSGVPMLQLSGDARAISVSHAGDWAGAAVGPLGMLGLDLEPHCAVGAVQPIMSRALSDCERAELAATSGIGLTESVTRRWVAKEAILKAAGCGIAVDPQRIALSFDANGGFMVRAVPGSLFGGRAIAVRFVPAPIGYCAAIAADRRDFELQMSMVANGCDDGRWYSTRVQ